MEILPVQAHDLPVMPRLQRFGTCLSDSSLSPGASGGARSHTLTMASAPPEATNLPSQEDATPTESESARSAVIRRRSAMAQSWMIPVGLAEISVRPSRENETP